MTCKSFYMEHNEKEEYYLNKINNKEKLTEKELSDLCDEFVIVVEEGDDHRWHRAVRTIVMLKDKFFAVDWMKGLTELQDDYYDDQPYEVTPSEEKITITIKWSRV